MLTKNKRTLSFWENTQNLKCFIIGMIYGLQIPKNCGYQLCRIQGESSKQCREWPVHLIACTTRLLQKKKKEKKKRLPVYLEDKMLRTWLGQRAKLTSSHKTYPRLDYWYHVTSSKSCGKAFCLKCFNFKISEIVLCLSNIKDIGK